ncbi:hypothetical protein [Microbacterium sp. Se63.02b]|uniref:hypothetical protein n=1 Tax=Microbacterium sp. Se63.02b TaxID=2709304 RepID=UPI0031F65D26
MGREADELLRLGSARGDLVHRRIGVAGGETCDGLVGLRDAGAQGGSLGAHLRDDLRRSSHLRHGLREHGGLLVEEILGPIAQLQDARIPCAQLLRSVGDLVVVQLVQLECLAQVSAHGDQRLAQISGQRLAELGLRERELIRGRADPLVRPDQGLLGATRQIGVLCGEFFLFAFASAPKSSHEPILVSRVRELAEHPLQVGGVRSGHVTRSLSVVSTRPSSGGRAS